jgi:hypothetical protein
MGRGEICAGFWLRSLKKSNKLEDRNRWEDDIKMDHK